ncbi:hypothetical protein EVAR_11522_1 [Eumeta japonica]|uniref:Uncharacterized protein n=1 Tax=Eumeta variegata TaxID=151549 RepID=A0A4C1TYY1_EUMVA|nr:hypothetical protein EVAR_11522_1 [Eumeta japonica]
MVYIPPNLVVTVTKELLYTYKNPMDVAYALKEVYSGTYSSKTQVEKESLIAQGFGNGEWFRVLTIHEAQGPTSEGTVIVPITAKQKLIARQGATRRD